MLQSYRKENVNNFTWQITTENNDRKNILGNGVQSQGNREYIFIIHFFSKAPLLEYYPHSVTIFH